MNDRFGLDDVQGAAILEMRLKRLTGLEREKLIAEIDELRRDIAYYEDLLGHPEKILAVISDELRDVSARFSDKRRTAISPMVAQDIDVEDLIAEEDMVGRTPEFLGKKIEPPEMRMKKAGKIKFFGFSSHTNMADCLEGATKLDFIDAVMRWFWGIQIRK